MSTCKNSTGIKSKIYRRGSLCSWAWRFVQSGKKGAEARRKTKYKKPSTILHRRPLHQWKMKHKWVETVFNLPCSMANSREQCVLCARCVPLLSLCVYTTTGWAASVVSTEGIWLQHNQFSFMSGLLFLEIVCSSASASITKQKTQQCEKTFDSWTYYGTHMAQSLELLRLLRFFLQSHSLFCFFLRPKTTYHLFLYLKKGCFVQIYHNGFHVQPNNIN